MQKARGWNKDARGCEASSMNRWQCASRHDGGYPVGSRLYKMPLNSENTVRPRGYK